MKNNRHVISVTDNRDMGGINGFFEEAVSMIPQEEFITTFFSKLESSNDFSMFFEKFGNGDFTDVVEHLKVSLTIFLEWWGGAENRGI